jgi:hypothetical protein
MIACKLTPSSRPKAKAKSKSKKIIDKVKDFQKKYKKYFIDPETMDVVTMPDDFFDP